MSHEQYTPIGKLSEQPPPFEFTSGTTRIGAIDPLGTAARLRIHALRSAQSILGDVTPQELVIAAHYIVTGELLQEGDNDEDE